jgi:hypothetical protein
LAAQNYHPPPKHATKKRDSLLGYPVSTPPPPARDGHPEQVNMSSAETNNINNQGISMSNLAAHPSPPRKKNFLLQSSALPSKKPKKKKETKIKENRGKQSEQ